MINNQESFAPIILTNTQQFIPTSGAAQTHSIWQNSITATKKERETIQHKDILNKEACPYCKQYGHLYYQCMQKGSKYETIPEPSKELKSELESQDRLIEKLKKAIQKKKDKKHKKKKRALLDSD